MDGADSKEKKRPIIQQNSIRMGPSPRYRSAQCGKRLLPYPSKGGVGKLPQKGEILDAPALLDYPTLPLIKSISKSTRLVSEPINVGKHIRMGTYRF